MLDEAGAVEMCSSKQCLPSALEAQHGAILPYQCHSPQWTSPSQLIWLAFQVCFIWANPGFVHSDDLSRKVVTFPLAPVQQGRRLHSSVIVAPRKFHGVSNALQVCINPECHAECGAEFCDIHRLTLLTQVQSIGDQHPTGKQAVELCYSPHGVILYGGCPKWPHASCCPWKHSCVLRPLATSILIQEHFSNFVNMVLGCSHYPYKSQRSSHCSRSTEYCRRWLH